MRQLWAKIREALVSALPVSEAAGLLAKESEDKKEQ